MVGTWFESFFAMLGRPFVALYRSFDAFGTFLIFQAGLIPLYFKRPHRIREFFQQMDIIGIGTLGVILLTALFTGMVEAIQLYHGFHRFGAENFMGYTIFVSISRELGPVFAALMVTSRAISAMAAELGTMRVTEQIDAIETLAIDSKKYLIIPRILATTVSLPLLVGVFDFVGNASAYLISTYALGVNPVAYHDTITQYLTFADIGTGVLKALVFGFLVSSIGTYLGYNAHGGARGVGRATTTAVVYAAVTIFAADYFLSSIFLLLNW